MKSAAESGPWLAGIPFFALLLTLLAGCSVLKKEIDVPVDPEALRFPEQETHYRTVLDRLGPPGKVSALPGGLAFLYEHARTDEKQIGLGLGNLGFFKQFLGWFKLSGGKGIAVRQALLLVFDERGVLAGQRFKEYRENLGSGGALQVFFQVAPLIDSSFLEDEFGPPEWGKSLLRPLPETLNARQSLDTGDHGLEQEGTATTVGQHTLELRR
jgi:hypothetical protein